MVDIYVGGELTLRENPEEKRRFYEKIANLCRELGFSAYLPHEYSDPELHPKETPQQIYEEDYKRVANAKIMIAYVGRPSLGTGTELEIAKNNNTDLILVHHKDEKVSRMARGNPAVKHIIQYESEEDLLNQLREILSK